MKINLKKLGTAETRAPESMSVCMDFRSLALGSANEAQKLRLYASAIAVCIDGSAKLPRYKSETADPVAFGGIIQERLYDAGVTPFEIMSMGSDCIVMMIEKTNPLFGGVDEKENFISEKEEGLTS